MEILIGITVLALGVLGLAALFPTVLRQQRLAYDQVVGLSAQRSAEALWNAGGPLAAGSGGALADFLRQPNFSDDGSWVLPNGETFPDFRLDLTTGDYTFVTQTPPRTLRVGIGARLDPRPIGDVDGARGPQPRYVWDVAIRRVLPTPLSGESPAERAARAREVQVATFVRRIDPGIVLRSGVTLFDALSGRVSVTPRLVAVAEDGQGRPALNGRGEYAQLRTFDIDRVERDAQGRSTLLVPANNAWGGVDWTLLRVPGQRLVTPDGTVLTVTGSVETDVGGRRRVVPVVTPPVGDSAANDGFTVIFAPQTPVAVSVTTLAP